MGEREESLFRGDPCEAACEGAELAFLGCRGDVLIHAVQGEPTLHLKTGRGVEQGFFIFFFPW